MSRYSAFISYSHADQATARWLHRRLETYRLPRALVGSPSPFGPIERRLLPVFRDREELPASGDLGHELRAALAETRFQIVLCSPRAAVSKWVNEEILTFKRLHGESRTLALILAGEPHSGGPLECFPPALRFQLDAAGELSETPAEPIAADIRPGKDGHRLALLKLIAGLSGLPLDALARRDAARRQRQLVFVAAASVSAAVVTGGLAIYAEAERRVADHQRRLADKSLEFLVGTFSIANPATENPRTITVLKVLDRASKRASTELADEPAISARLLRTTGEIYYNLGLPRESERDLKAALALEPRQSEGRARALLKLSALAYSRADAAASRRAIDEAARSYSSSAPYAPALDAQIAERRAMVEILAGHYSAAADGLAEAAGLYRQLKGDMRQDLGRVWLNEAQSLVRLRRFAEADRLFTRATAMYAARFGTEHVLTADAIRSQAVANFEAGRLIEAEQGMDRAVAIYGRVYEGDHPTMADALIATGRIRSARGESAAALAAFDRARGIFERLYGPRNAAVGDVDFYAAEAESARGNTGAALRLLARTKVIYDASYGPADPDQVELLLLRARVLAAGRRFGEARSECTAGLALKSRLDPRDPTLDDTRRTCAAIGASNGPQEPVRVTAR
jgi:tetratricopeptide (TPR) repeat protein